METVLLVKTSSLGDVIHNLPAVSDMRRARGAASVDWVVEESFAAIARLHPGVANIIPVAIRRWRRVLGRRGTWREIRRFVQVLRGKRYDAVIDAQGLLKSAVITATARGARYGLDWSSSREPLRLFYDRTFRVPWTLHAVERNRALAAQALGYEKSAQPDYGIRAGAVSFPWLRERRYVVLLHASSARNKLWPESCWIQLATHFEDEEWGCVLPWGSTEEHARSLRLAAHLRRAVVPPALALGELAGLLAGASAVAGVDTGLTHLAGALGVPTAGIYCATDPAATGLYGCARAVNVGGIGRPPAAAEVRTALARVKGNES